MSTSNYYKLTTKSKADLVTSVLFMFDLKILRRMLLTLFGTKDRRKVEAQGQFVCPRCRVDRRYEVISLREWFTLFFIPILPTANEEGRDYFVECRTCNSTYDPDVLEELTGTEY